MLGSECTLCLTQGRKLKKLGQTMTAQISDLTLPSQSCRLDGRGTMSPEDWVISGCVIPWYGLCRRTTDGLQNAVVIQPKCLKGDRSQPVQLWPWSDRTKPEQPPGPIVNSLIYMWEASTHLIGNKVAIMWSLTSRHPSISSPFPQCISHTPGGKLVHWSRDLPNVLPNWKS